MRWCCGIIIENVLYSRKLLREKTFTNFAVLEPLTSQKFFSMKFGRVIPMYLRKSLSFCVMVTSYRSVKVSISPSKVYSYTLRIVNVGTSILGLYYVPGLLMANKL